MPISVFTFALAHSILGIVAGVGLAEHLFDLLDHLLEGLKVVVDGLDLHDLGAGLGGVPHPLPVHVLDPEKVVHAVEVHLIRALHDLFNWYKYSRQRIPLKKASQNWSL